MTGRTHDQIAAATALAAGAALRLPIEGCAEMLCGAIAVARAPDYIEPTFRVAHRTWTHYLPTAAAIATALLVGLLLAGAPLAFAGPLAGGVLIGWCVHSLADGLTNSGCWLTARRRQALLPRRLRISVYTVTQSRNRLTGQATTTKRPSMGERCYLRGAQLVVAGLVVLQVSLFGHAAMQRTHSRGGLLAPSTQQAR